MSSSLPRPQNMFSLEQVLTSTMLSLEHILTSNHVMLSLQHVFTSNYVNGPRPPILKRRVPSPKRALGVPQHAVVRIEPGFMAEPPIRLAAPRIARIAVMRALDLRPTVALRYQQQRGMLLPWEHPAGFWVPQPKSPHRRRQGSGVGSRGEGVGGRG